MTPPFSAPGPGGDGPAQREPLRRFLPVTLLTPLLGAALGIDGGALFQILAVENLQLSPAAIGTAFGLGLLSLPFQLWAARLPLHRARRNVQLFLWIGAAQGLILAGLLATGTTGVWASTALVVTVTAEIALSVLFATAWQPLLSARARTADRQRLNTFWPAVARGALAGTLVAFSASNTAGRTLILVGLAAAAVAAAVLLRRVDEAPAAAPAAAVEDATAPASGIPIPMRWILASFALLNIGALPLWLVYLDDVAWPTANLGLVAAIQTLASVVALLAWRTTEGPLHRRANVGVGLVLLGSLTLLAISGTVDTGAERAAVFALTATMAGGATYTRVALLETAHRTVDTDSSVRSFTYLDVVASSALQLGLFAGGMLVTASSVAEGPNPFVWFVVATTIAATATVIRAGHHAAPGATERGP